MFEFYLGCMGWLIWSSLGDCCFGVTMVSCLLDVRVDWFSVMAARSAYWIKIVFILIYLNSVCFVLLDGL